MKRRAAPNVFLLGFMASGKTSVGKALARELGWRFVDTDELIERTAGRSIAAIFAEEGEEGFRRMEERAVAAAAMQKNRVVALGGGAVIRPRNTALIRRKGVAVFLHAPLEEILARAEREGLGKRPLLNRFDRATRRAVAARLLKRRLPMYRAAAHMTLHTASAFPEALALRLVKRLRREGYLP